MTSIAVAYIAYVLHNSVGLPCDLLNQAYQHECIEAVDGLCSFVVQEFLATEVEDILAITWGCWWHTARPILWLVSSHNGWPDRLLLNVMQGRQQRLCRARSQVRATAKTSRRSLFRQTTDNMTTNNMRANS